MLLIKGAYIWGGLYSGFYGISIQKSGKNRIKLSKFRLGGENFFRRNILSDENFKVLV